MNLPLCLSKGKKKRHESNNYERELIFLTKLDNAVHLVLPESYEINQ
jgi:hypothetical protein